MKFYRIRQTGNKKITGLNDGGAQANHDENTYRNQEEWKKYENFLLGRTLSIKDQLTTRVFPSARFNMEIELRKKARATDFLTFANALGRDGSFIISNKVVNILKTTNALRYQLHNVNVKNRPVQDYKFFYYPALPLEYLNLNKSVFYTGSGLRQNQQYHQINSVEEYVKLRIEKTFVNCERIVLNEQPCGELDIFGVVVTASLFISEKLKDLFEMFDTTGIVIQEPHDEEIEITNC